MVKNQIVKKVFSANPAKPPLNDNKIQAIQPSMKQKFEMITSAKQQTLD